MKIALGAPVAERAWILPEWGAALARQSHTISDLCFVYSESEDETLECLHDLTLGGACAGATLRIHKTKLPYYTRNNRNNDPEDPWRAHHMAKLRNQLRKLFLQTDADIFVSLDTDVILTEGTELERLIDTLIDGWDVMAGLTHLHPLGEEFKCYNAGFLGGNSPGNYDQDWARVDENTVRVRQSPIRIDIPMAFFAIRRHPMAMCSYRGHECGEDVGFGQSLKAHNMAVGWRTDVVGQHIWSEQYLIPRP